MARFSFFFLLFFSAYSLAAEKVRVLALFVDKAMLEIDGKRKVLSVGQTYRSGVKLLKANPRFAEILINGKPETLKIGSAVNARFAARERSELRLLSNNRDSFYTDALVNGQPMRMLVDTGATTVAMSENHARKLGINYVAIGQKVGVSTASGRVAGFKVVLNSLKVGEVSLQNVKAIVIEGNSPTQMLLGMNVLSQFEMEQKEKLLILRTKY